ncbi:aldehyde dehydrogenase [Streptomyces viridochromogenes DSM 40736]|uniref:Aldehyde dehydrogenase n=1 Tax=Streptomyces viridochromogenes (strain DSM 40736 / JCM 4977 / BCRC 1201 / Tue 494) TaxID=591159 RepID=D9WZS5_STRVT|nr:aldehyde dehydrogenase [Streptomyces viridochromogenes DSM 40736]
MLPAAGLRGHRRRGRLPRRRHQPPRRHRDPAHPGPAPLQGAPGRRRRLLGVELPLRLLGRRRRHRERAGGRLPGRRQGPPRPPGPVRVRREDAAPGRRPARHPRGRRGPGPRLRGGRRADQAPAGRGGRLHRVRARAGARCSTRPRPVPVPIPFHGELGSLNPVVVTEAAAAERAEAIGSGLAGSMTLGVGQFCVKPGLVLAPSGAAGDALLKSLTDAVSDTDAGVLLDHRMRDNFVAGVAERAALPDVDSPVTPGAGGDHTVSAGFLTVPASRLAAKGEHDLLLEECFGPVTVVARYEDEAEVKAVLSRLPGNLTATVQLSEEEAAGQGRGAELLQELTPLAGRVLVNGWPTGVAVAPAQHHGGPYPATTSTSTSVGGTAIERWLRPVVYQNTPAALLPAELRDENPLGLPRRFNGVLER